MRIYDTQTAFTRGELNPRLHARTDIDHYRLGLMECTNWYVLPQGGLRKRPGTEFIAAVKDAARPTRMIPFTFSREQAFMLEFGHLYFRVYVLGTQVQAPGGGAYEVATPYTDAQIFDIQYTQSADTLYLAHAGHPPRKVGRIADDDWVLEEMAFRDGPYLRQADTATTTLTPGATGGVIPAMTSNTHAQGVASASLASNPAWHAFDGNEATAWSAEGSSHWVEFNPTPPEKAVNGYVLQSGVNGLENMMISWKFQGFDGTDWITLDTRRNETAWAQRELRYYAFENAVAYESYRIRTSASDGGTDQHLSLMQFKENPDTAQDLITLTASGTDGINGGDGFLSSDAGRAIRLQGSDGVWRWFRIENVTGSMAVEGRLYGRPLPDLEPIRRFRMGAWSAATGYPASVTFFEERLVWARTDTEPQKVWGSKSFGFDDHGVSLPLADDDAFAVEIASGEVNEIRWIAGGPDLLVGTSATIRTIGAADASKPFSASNVRQRRHAAVGTAGLQPVRAEPVVLYADGQARGLRELIFSFDSNAFTASDLTILSDHLLESGIVAMAYAEVPDSIVWLATGDGDLVSLTFEREQRVVGISRHAVAGGHADSQGQVESLAAIPGATATELWLVVRRTIDGETCRHVERLVTRAETAPVEDGAFLDSFKTYESGTVEGLGHLEGETLGILADGSVLPDQTVSGGAVTLPDAEGVSKAIAGLRYTAKARQLLPALAGADGAYPGRLKSVPELIVDVQESLALKAGPEGSEEAFLDREAGEPMGVPMSPRTGAFRVFGSGRWRGEGVISLISEDPLPATVRAITRGLEIEP